MTLSRKNLRGGRMTKVAGNAASYAPRATASVIALSMLALSSGAAYFGTEASTAFAANECGPAGGANATINCTGNKPNGITYNNLQGATVNLNSSSMNIGGGAFNFGGTGITLASTGGNALILNANSYDTIYGPVRVSGDGTVAANFSGGEITDSLYGGGRIAVTLTAGGAADYSGAVTLDGTTVDLGNFLSSGVTAVGIDGNADGSAMEAVITGGSSIDLQSNNSFGVRLRGSGSGNTGTVLVDGNSSIDAYFNLSVNSTVTAISVETSGASSMGYVSLSGDSDISASATNSGLSSLSRGVFNRAGDGGVNTIVDDATLSSTATSLLTSTALGIDNQSTGGTAEASVKGAGSVSATANSLVSIGTDQASATAIRNVSDTQNATVFVAEDGTVTSEATITFGNAVATGVFNTAGLNAAVVLEEGAITATASATDLGAATVSGVINTGGPEATTVLDESGITATASGTGVVQATAVDNTATTGRAGVGADAGTIMASATSTSSYAVSTAIENRAETEARIRIRGGSVITSRATGAASAGLGGFAASSTGVLNASTAGDASTVIDEMSSVAAGAFSTSQNTNALAVNTFTSLGEARTALDNGSTAVALAESELDATALAVRNFSYDGAGRVELDNGSTITATADSVAGSATATGIMAVAVGDDAIVRLLGASKVSVDVSGSDVYAYGIMNTLSGAGTAGVEIDAGSVVDVGTVDEAGTIAYVTGVSNAAKDPLGAAYASIKGLVSGTAEASGASEVFGVVNAAAGGEAVIELSESAEVTAEGTSENDIATAVAIENTNTAGLAKGVVAGAGRVTAYAEGSLDTNATGFSNVSGSGFAGLALAEAGSVSATAISGTASAEARALNNFANDGDAFVELLDASLASAEAKGQIATARTVANEVHGAGEAFLDLGVGSTLLAKATASDEARAVAATNFAHSAGGSATAMLGGLISVGADGTGDVIAGGVWNSSRFGDADMIVLGTGDVKVGIIGALDASATGLRNMTEEGRAQLLVEEGASISAISAARFYSAASGMENVATGDGRAHSILGGLASAMAASFSDDADATGLSTDTYGAGDAVTDLRSTASVNTTVGADNGRASSIGVASTALGTGNAYTTSEAGSYIQTIAEGGTDAAAIGLGAISQGGNATLVTAGDIVLDATASGEVFAAAALARVNNGGKANLTMNGGSITATASASGAAVGLGSYTSGAGATYAVNALGGSVAADIGIKTESEAGQTGTVVIGSDAAITASGGHDGMALVDLDGEVTVTTTGTVVGTAWLGAGDDSFNLAGGSWTGDIQGEDGNDAFNWTGGALNSGFYGGAGNDTAYLGGGAVYDGTEVFDGGAGVDALTFNGVSATTAGSLIANWESFSLDNTMLTLTGGAITVGSTADASQGIYLNNSTLQVNESTAFNGNMFLNPGSTLSSVNGATGDAMTVTGNLTGGGTLAIDVDLANAVGDSLTVNGANLGGVTTLSLNELSTGYASGKAIEIITLDGGEQGNFVLPGYNVSGAYAYALSEVGNQYFLTGDFSNATPVYEVLPELMLTLNRPDSLQDRVGERYWNLGDVSDPGYVWADFTGGREHYDGTEGTLNASYNADIYRLRMGVDAQFGETESGFAVGGLVFQYANASADVSSRVGGGDVVSQLFGMGATMTWYGNNGFYVDGQAFGNVINNEITIAGTPTLGMQQSYGYSLSAETGYRFDVAPGWALTPQAQLTWGSVNFDDFTGVYNEDVSLVNGDSLAARMGLQTDYRTDWTTATGEARSASFHGIANVYYDFTNDPSEVRVSGVNMSTDDGDWTGEIGIGGSYTWLNGKLGINGDVTASTGLENFGDSYGLTGKVRFQMQW
ncbi:autotransporter outer membrane beta-barrel domain-containing protein [Martelella sp. FLE1502]